MHDDGRKGRFKLDDTVKKWTTRYFVTVGVAVHGVAALVIAGLVKVFT